MKLYFSPGACSLASHIALAEAGLDYQLERVDLRTHKTENGADYYGINPKGYVPCLGLKDGQTLTEVGAILQFIGDQKPTSNLVPAAGSFERYRLQEWLAFISSEIHKTFSPLFNPATPDQVKAAGLEKLGKRFEYVDAQLAGKSYLLGEHFSVADAYLFVMLRWASKIGPSLESYPSLSAWKDRVAARPGVTRALETESGRS